MGRGKNDHRARAREVTPESLDRAVEKARHNEPWHECDRGAVDGRFSELADVVEGAGY